ncbi:hypothetical protein J437_LFUL018170, partial [Ladona fulva]
MRLLNAATSRYSHSMGLAESASATPRSTLAATGSSPTPLMRDETARVAVLSDGTCAFYKGRRRSQPSLEGDPHLRRAATITTDCHYTCHPQCRDLVTLDCRAVEAETLDQSGSLSVSEAREASDELDSEISD